MKKQLIAGCIILGAMGSAFADAQSDLQNRLNKVSTLHAQFTQTVLTAKGENIQSATGELWLKRPTLFRWYMAEPDESLLVSDGKTVWFYNPFVEQVTITHLSDVAEDTPFMLISRNSPSDWSKYQVKQKGDIFELTPKVKGSELKPFAITVTKNGKIDSFEARELDGQRNIYKLKNQKNSNIDVSTFTFTPPKGVTIDDQR